MGKRSGGIQTGKKNSPGCTESNSGRESRSSTLAKKGLRTSTDFAAVMSALVGDVLNGTIPTQTANAACNAGGKLLKVVEMRHRYAPKGKVLRLSV